MANREYVERRNGGYYVAGTRVSQDSIVYAFLSGDSAEMIQKSFSTLRLEEVYGGIAFYLANQSEVDEYLVSAEKEYALQLVEARQKDPELYKRLEETRKTKQVTQHPVRPLGHPPAGF